MTQGEVAQIVESIRFNDWHFLVGPMGEGFCLQVAFSAWDNDPDSIAPFAEMRRLSVHRGRKWYISAFSTPSEIVQTALKAVLTALEHEAREQFTYCGEAIFHPHTDLNELIERAQSRSVRKEQKRA